MLKFLKKQIIVVLLFIFFVELLLQISFHFNVKFINQPILFYNGYCHQKYWDLNLKKFKFNENIIYHPILAYKKKELDIPNKFQEKQIVKKGNFSKTNVALYGSSFLDHKKFKSIIKNNKEIKFKNYSLSSYGLDQIYLSYKLTSHLNQNKIIVFGFLLEDLDRSIFNKRDYNKPKFDYINNNFKLTNIPVDQNHTNKKRYDLYLFKFLSNFLNLLFNDFDPRLNTCFMSDKKKLFNYFFENIQIDAEKYNQKVIVITFNLKEDMLKNKSWRYDFIKNYFAQKNITHIDALEILKKSSIKNNESIKDYYSDDLHNSKKGFELIIKDFFKIYNAI